VPSLNRLGRRSLNGKCFHRFVAENGDFDADAACALESSKCRLRGIVLCVVDDETANDRYFSVDGVSFGVLPRACADLRHEHAERGHGELRLLRDDEILSAAATKSGASFGYGTSGAAIDFDDRAGVA